MVFENSSTEHPPAPIFILSCARSGSTLLRYILDTHPAIYAPPELNLGQLAFALLVMENGLHGRRMNGDASDLQDQALLAKVRAGIMRPLAEHTRQRGKVIWCEKSPPNLSFLELLEAVFPDARFLCLYRNRLDTIHSCLEASRYHHLPPIRDYAPRHPSSLLAAAAQYWIDGTAKLMALERQPERRTHRVRYEDLVTRPAETLAGIFSFLELPFREDLVDAVYKTPHDEGFGDISIRFAGGIHRDSIGRGRVLPLAMLSEEQRLRMQELDRQLGYTELIAEILAAPAPAPAAAPGGEVAASPGKSPRWFFETQLPARLEEQQKALGVLGGSYLFAVSGEGGGAWVLRRDDDGRFRIQANGHGDGAQTATSIRLEAQDLLGIAAGQLNVIKLVNEGRIAFTGAPPRVDQIEVLVKLLRAEL